MFLKERAFIELSRTAVKNYGKSSA